MKILLVDDDAAILDVLGVLLTTSGHEIEAVNDPRYALVRFREAAKIEVPFDVVITDFNMPVWSGLTLAMHIANCCAAYQIKAPVICITGNGIDVRRMNERDGGPLALVLDKGCPLKDIESAIKCVTERTKAAGA